MSFLIGEKLTHHQVPDYGLFWGGNLIKGYIHFHAYA